MIVGFEPKNLATVGDPPVDNPDPTPDTPGVGATLTGASIVVDGRSDVRSDGFFLNPTLLDGVRPGMDCYDDEIFGPAAAMRSTMVAS